MLLPLTFSGLSRTRLPAFLVLGLLATAAHAQSAPPNMSASLPLPADSAAQVDQYTNWFLQGRVDSLFAHYSNSMRAVMKKSAGLVQTWAQFVGNAGNAGDMIEEGWMSGKSTRRYYRLIRFSRSPEPVALTWYLTPRGEITFMGLGLESAFRKLQVPRQ